MLRYIINTDISNGIGRLNIDFLDISSCLILVPEMVYMYKLKSKHGICSCTSILNQFTFK